MRKRKLMVVFSSMGVKYMVVFSVTKKYIYLKRLMHELAFALSVTNKILTKN